MNKPSSCNLHFPEPCPDDCDAKGERFSNDQQNHRLDMMKDAEIETRRRENLGKPTRDYPGASQMMAWQRDYK